MCIAGLTHVWLASATENCLDQQAHLFFLFSIVNLGWKKLPCQWEKTVPREGSGCIHIRCEMLCVPHSPFQAGSHPHNSPKGSWQVLKSMVFAIRSSTFLCSDNKLERKNSSCPGKGGEKVYRGMHSTHALKPAGFGWSLYLGKCSVLSFQRLLDAERCGWTWKFFGTCLCFQAPKCHWSGPRDHSGVTAK